MNDGPTGRRRYAFRPVRPDDRALLARWRTMPHVRDWWGEPGAPGAADDPRVDRWIVSLDHEPFAYLQDYDVHGWPGHHFGHLPPGARGVDLYIGEADKLGQGHGSGLARERLDALLAAGSPAVAADPHPANARSIAAFRRAGFRPEGGPVETAWGLALPLIAWADGR